MIIRSAYRDSEKEQFSMEVIGEDVFMGEPAYVCILLKEYRDKFKDGHKKCLIRKSIVGEGHIYRIVENPKPVQLTLF